MKKKDTIWMRMKNHTPEEIKLGFDFVTVVKKRDRFAALEIFEPLE